MKHTQQAQTRRALCFATHSLNPIWYTFALLIEYWCMLFVAILQTCAHKKEFCCAHWRRRWTRIWFWCSCFSLLVCRRMLFNINKNYDVNGVCWCCYSCFSRLMSIPPIHWGTLYSLCYEFSLMKQQYRIPEEEIRGERMLLSSKRALEICIEMGGKRTLRIIWLMMIKQHFGA